MSGRWADTTPADAERWLSGVDAPWWIAGGWAIELWLGRPVRPHSDLEIGCFRDDLPAILRAFEGWEIVVSRNKQLTPLTGDPARLERPFSLWLRRAGLERWDLEILSEDREGDRWLYRRDHRIWRPTDDLTIRAAKHRVIRPEIQLLFSRRSRVRRTSKILMPPCPRSIPKRDPG